MALDHELVDVRRLGGIERREGEVVEDEQVDPQQAAQLGVVGGVEAGCPEALEDPVGAPNEDAPPAPAKTDLSRSGPLQSQSNQVNNNIAEMAVTRLVSGKRFENRERVWYDSAYRGQATANVNRGTDTYKKLDGGLRKIADTLGGTVVVVWKEKAYRIQ